MIKKCTEYMEKKFINSPIFFKICKRYYKSQVDKEIESANIKSTDRVLIIGGGAIPCTAINIAVKLGAKVDVIDIDIEAVRKSRELVKKLKLSEYINIYLDTGQNVDSSKYDVVHIALQVSPKEDVIDNIYKKSNNGTRIIVRQPKAYLKGFYSNISKKYYKDIKKDIKYIGRSNILNTMDNLLVLRKS